MPRKVSVNESTNGKQKILVNIGEHRKEWLRRVAELGESNVTEVLQLIIDQVSVEDPESFAVRIQKGKLKRKLEDIERRERAIQDEKESLLKTLEVERVQG